jgi:hypothetical protein
MCYMLLHVIYWTKCCTDKYLKIYTPDVPILTQVFIHNVGYYYYYYYYYTIVTGSCKVFRDIAKVKNVKSYENYCSTNSTVI